MNDLDSQKRILIKGVVIVFIVILVLFLSALIYIYMNKVNQDSILVTPNKFFCPIGEEIDTPILVKLEDVNEVFSMSYGVLDLLFSSNIYSNPAIELANTMYGILQDIDRKYEVNKIKQIEIPEKACYIGSENSVPNSMDQSFLSGLEFDLLHTDIQLYAWNTEYKRNSGKKGNEIHIIMSLNENVVYGKIQKLGNTKMQMDIIYGYKN